MSSKGIAMAAEAAPSNNAAPDAGPRRGGADAARWALSVGAGIVFLVPLSAAWPLEPAGPAVFAFGAGLALLSALSPPAGLATLIALLPLSVVLERLFGGVPAADGVVDIVVIAFAAGASVRRLPAGDRPGRLVVPAGLLAAAILTSTIVEVRALQAITPRESVLPDLWRYLTREYWTELREFQVLRHTFRWLGWLAIAVHAERILASRHQGMSRRVLQVWFAAGLVGALIVVHRMFAMVLGSEQAFRDAMADLWRHTRLSVLQPDVNAAGSYLLLFLVPTIIVGLARQRRWLLGVCLPPLLAAFALARSRAAIGAGVLVICTAAILYLWRTRRSGRWLALSRPVLAATILAFGVSAMAGTYYWTAGSHATLGDAARVRLDLISSGVEALKRNPMFGVGLSDYIRSTRRFVTPDMTLLLGMAPDGENAHNNLLQIAVELGVPACVVFLWLIWRAVRPALTSRAGPVGQGMALGVAAFLLSALSGHPLLIPLVGAAFFAAVGLTAGVAGPADESAPLAEMACWLMAGVYLGSLLWRW